MGINTAAVQRLYVAYFNRPADPVGLAHWEAQLGTTAATQAQLTTLAASGFSGSAEYAALYAGQSNAQIVNNLYLNLFGRSAETAGLVHWAGKLTDGTETFASVALQLTYSAQGTDATAIANKLSAATSFTTALDTAAEIIGYSGTAAAASGRTYLAAVTNVAATLTTATAATALAASVAAAVAAGTATAGTSFTLTTGVDNPATSSNSTTYNGQVGATGGGTATDTLNAADVINGGGPADVLNITNTVTNTDVTNGATLSNIETINIRAATGAVATLNASTDAGLTAVNANAGAGAVTVTNLATGASIGVIGNGTVLNGTTTYDYKTASAAQTINISGGTTGGNITNGSGSGMTTATINSNGSAANTVGTIKLDNAGAGTITSLTINAAADLTAVMTAADFNAAAALVVTGAAPTTVLSTRAIASGVDLGTATINFATIDASGMTAGGVGMVLGTGVTSFKGGAGNDSVTTATLTATTAGEVNAGAGTGDRLIVAAAANVNTATKGAEWTGFEILQNNASANLDVSLIAGITSVVANATSASFTNMTAAQAANVTVQVTDDTATFGLTTSSGTSDVLNVKLQAVTDAADSTKINFTTQTITGFETLNVNVLSGINTAIAAVAAGTADKISFAAASNLKSLVVTGNKDVEITLANATAVTTLDVSALTGAATGAGLTLAANTGALVVTGTANTDYVLLATVGTNGTTSVNTSGGNDNVNGTAAQVAAQTVNGGLGTDTLVLSDATLGTLSDNSFVNITGFEKLTLSSTNTYNVTSGGFFNTAFVSGVTITGATATAGQLATIDLSTYNQAATATLVTSSINTGAAIVLKGGSAADTLVVTAAGYTGVSGGLVISGGAGADTISWTDLQTGVASASVITGGAGADLITHTSTGAASAFAATTYSITGTTDSTVTAYDQITGFVLGAGGATNSDKLDLADTATLAATATATASGVSNVTYTVSAAGLLAFAGTGAADLTVAQAAAIALLAASTDGNEVAFVLGANSYVFHHDVASGDQLVGLVGVTALGVSLTTVSTGGYVWAV